MISRSYMWVMDRRRVRLRIILPVLPMRTHTRANRALSWSRCQPQNSVLFVNLMAWTKSVLMTSTGGRLIQICAADGGWIFPKMIPDHLDPCPLTCTENGEGRPKQLLNLFPRYWMIRRTI